MKISKKQLGNNDRLPRTPLQSIENSKNIRRRRSLSADHMQDRIKDVKLQISQTITSFEQPKKPFLKSNHKNAHIKFIENQVKAQSKEIKTLKDALGNACDENTTVKLMKLSFK